MCKKRPVEVRDHDHFTGEFIAGACNKCNLSRRVRQFLPIVFHNLRGYDMHHILKYAMNKFTTWKLSVIPQTEEKFLAMTCRVNFTTLKFMDSLQFLNSSLAALAKCVGVLPHTMKVFDSEIVKGKGLFPYEMATSLEVLESITAMPPMWPGVANVEEYDFACKMWTKYHCQNLLQYMQIYLKLDCYLTGRCLRDI